MASEVVDKYVKQVLPKLLSMSPADREQVLTVTIPTNVRKKVKSEQEVQSIVNAIRSNLALAEVNMTSMPSVATGLTMVGTESLPIEPLPIGTAAAAEPILKRPLSPTKERKEEPKAKKSKLSLSSKARPKKQAAAAAKPKKADVTNVSVTLDGHEVDEEEEAEGYEGQNLDEYEDDGFVVPDDDDDAVSQVIANTLGDAHNGEDDDEDDDDDDDDEDDEDDGDHAIEVEGGFDPDKFVDPQTGEHDWGKTEKAFKEYCHARKIKDAKKPSIINTLVKELKAGKRGNLAGIELPVDGTCEFAQTQAKYARALLERKKEEKETLELEIGGLKAEIAALTGGGKVKGVRGCNQLKERLETLTYRLSRTEDSISEQEAIIKRADKLLAAEETKKRRHHHGSEAESPPRSSADGMDE